MNKIVKRIGLVLGGFMLLALIAGVGLAIAGTIKLSKTYTVATPSVAIPTDAAALARGEHLTSVFCADCHTADLSGRLFFDEAPIGTIYASNLTGLAESRSDAELVLAIRHGLDGNGRPLMIMPAESFIHFSKADLGAIIAYLKTLPRTGADTPANAFRPMGRILIGLGAFDSSLSASYINHDQPFAAMPALDDALAQGEYLSRFCQGCHGADLAGGQPPAPDSPAAPSLLAVGGWTEIGFITAMRTGVTPGGYALDGEFMPWESLGKLTDAELGALWAYLVSQPPQAATAE